MDGSVRPRRTTLSSGTNSHTKMDLVGNPQRQSILVVDDNALNAELLTVTRAVFCHEGFQAAGEISLVGASIGGQLALRGAHLDGHEGAALNGEGLTVARGMFCDLGFQAAGQISLRRESDSACRLEGRTLTGKEY